MQIKIAGYSDDVICVKDDNGFDDEFPLTETIMYLHINDDIIISAQFGPPDSDLGWYFDIIKCPYNNSSVVVGDQYEKDLELIIHNCSVQDVSLWSSEDGPTEDDLNDQISNINLRKLNFNQKSEIVKILRKV